MPILERYTKQPGETRFYDITFARYLARRGDAARTADPLQFACEDGIVLDSVEWVFPGNFARLWFSGGTHGANYKATVWLHTMDGERLEADILIKVRD